MPSCRDSSPTYVPFIPIALNFAAKTLALNKDKFCPTFKHL